MSESPQDVQVAKNAGEAAEASRQSTHSPESGSDPGVVLDDPGAGGLAALGIDPDAGVPAMGPATETADYDV